MSVTAPERPKVQYFRCAGVRGCGKEGTFSQLEIHLDREHGGGGRIDAVLEHTGTTPTGAPVGGTSLEDHGARTPDGAGSGPLNELPSDDARSRWQEDPPKKKSASRARRSQPQPGHEYDQPVGPKPTPEERKRAQQKIEEAKRRARGEA